MSLTVVARSNIYYDYSIVPQLTNITGCESSRLDDDWNTVVQTVDCPTAGNVKMALYGGNLILPLTLSVGGNFITDKQVTPDNSALFFTLPPGTGQGLNIVVCTL